MAKKTKHLGFKSIQQKIHEQQNVSMKQAGAILANAGRRASKSAHRHNPRLNRIMGR